MEQTDLCQVKTDVFHPVTLPGEIKSRSSKQCVGFSSGFVYTVRDQSHLTTSHHQHDPDLCIDDATSSDLLFDDQLAQRTSVFECSFASGFDVNANSAMGKLCTGRRDSVAKTCSAMPSTRHSGIVANCAGLVATSLIKDRSNRVHSFAGSPGPSRQSVRLNGCVRQKTWRMRRHHELYVHSAASISSHRSKGQNERKAERSYHDQPKCRTDCRGCSHQGERRRRCMSKMRPRTLCLQHRFGTDSTLSWMDSRQNTVYADQSMPQWSHNPWSTLMKACHDGAVVPGGLQNTNRTGGGNSASGSGGPGTLPRRNDGIQKSTSFKRLDSPGASFGCKPSLGTGTIHSVATSPSTISASSISAAARGGIDDRSLPSASRGRRIHWGPVEYGHGNGSDWCVLAQSNTTSEPESMNHQQDGSGNARSNGKKKDEPVLTASLVLKEHPFEIKQEKRSSRACSGDSGAWHLVTPPLIGSILVSVISQR